jgi:hypothetical protein
MSQCEACGQESATLSPVEILPENNTVHWCADCMIYELGIGECDKCEETYDIGSQIDHCGKCGTCWSHCDCVSDA